MPTHNASGRWLAFGAVIFVTIATALGGAMAEEEIQDPALKARLDAADSGVAEIDVSAYPPAAQERYQTFAATCKKCHTLARPINSDYALPEEWLRYVKRMMRKPGSGITSTNGKSIYQFLVYDSSVRKAALVEQKLSELSAAEREQQEQKIAEISTELGAPAD